MNTNFDLVSEIVLINRIFFLKPFIMLISLSIKFFYELIIYKIIVNISIYYL